MMKVTTQDAIGAGFMAKATIKIKPPATIFRLPTDARRRYVVGADRPSNYTVDVAELKSIQYPFGR